MIRLIYWLLVIIEVVLLLCVLVLFIITDSRSIKYIANTSLESSKFTYEAIEGNLLEGLEVTNLKYDKKPLFNSARLYWNPLTLFYKKITITKLDVQGIEIDNIFSMIDNLNSKKSESNAGLDFSLILNSSHFEINPYVYEGVKFSSFVFETGKIFVDKDLTVKTDELYLKFDSDIVNVELRGKLEDKKLLVDDLILKNISTKEITRLKSRLSKKVKNKTNIEQSKNPIFIKKIKVKHLLGTIKPVSYGDLKIKSVKLDLYALEIDPFNNFEYKAKKVTFKGKTNLGILDYKGDIKKSIFYTKGDITLDKKAFSKYKLPLNFEALKVLPSTLKLSHTGIWLDIEHSSNKLLKIENDFNVDIKNAKHKLKYIYKGDDLVINSKIKGSTSYADNLTLDIKTIIDFNTNTTLYDGNITLANFKRLDPKLSEYFLEGFQGKFTGDSKNLSLDIETNLLIGSFDIKDFKEGNLKLDSKNRNLVFSRIVDNIHPKYAQETFSFKSQSYLEFNNFDRLKTNIDINSNLINIKVENQSFMPTNIDLDISIPHNSKLRNIDKSINFDKIDTFKSNILIDNDDYSIKIKNLEDTFNLSLDYNLLRNSINNGKIKLGNEKIDFSYDNGLKLRSNINNIQSFFKEITPYYKIEIPSLQGQIDLDIIQNPNGLSQINLSSDNLKYLSDSGVNISVVNIYDIDTSFTIDSNMNIVLNKYDLRIDSNDYIDRFYSSKVSYLSVENSELNFKEVWLNDQILIEGKYNLKTQNGLFNIDSSSFKFKNNDLDLNHYLDLKVVVKGKKIDIEGDINILEGSINYEFAGSGIVEDTDIIILQDMLKQKDSSLQNLKLYLKVFNKQPLNYSGDGSSIDFYNELSIVKSFNQEILLTGTTTISGGYYQYEDKKFILDKSHLYFTGDLKKPLLDIKANYEKDQYSVHIFISGTTDEPIVNFNSVPYLTQQEILSLILFDGTGSSSGKGAEAYTLLGGTFAKGLIKSLGIDVDHLLLGTDAEEQLSLEIGKKISKNISILYLHKDGLDGAKVRIEHSNSFETDIIIQPPNTSSIEFLYKQDR